MLQVHEGQCGLCAHFGEIHAAAPSLLQIRAKGGAGNVSRRLRASQACCAALKVTPISGCDGFEVAKNSRSTDTQLTD